MLGLTVTDNNWTIIRIWERDLKENFDESIMRIKNIIMNSKDNKYIENK